MNYFQRCSDGFFSTEWHRCRCPRWQKSACFLWIWANFSFSISITMNPNSVLPSPSPISFCLCLCFCLRFLFRIICFVLFVLLSSVGGKWKWTKKRQCSQVKVSFSLVRKKRATTATTTKKKSNNLFNNYDCSYCVCVAVCCICLFVCSYNFSSNKQTSEWTETNETHSKVPHALAMGNTSARARWWTIKCINNECVFCA